MTDNLEDRVKKIKRGRLKDILKEVLMWGVLTSGLILEGGAIYRMIDVDLKNKKYCEFATPICEMAIRTADKNYNGYLDAEESVRLARELGFKGVIPTNSPVISLTPKASSGFSYPSGKVNVRLSSGGSDINGTAYGHPVYDECFETNLSELKKFIQINTEGENRK